MTKPRAVDKLVTPPYTFYAGQMMNIDAIQKCVLDGNYLIKSHAIVHALKEGFERRQMVEAVLNGKVIEEYPATSVLLFAAGWPCQRKQVFTCTSSANMLTRCTSSL
ncbi:MAG TPA: hypothetical protein VLJ61_14050 [Pyrinomonadaceae bacterium]|nr:hypothetical protein [Pyrinomonadaceae bacterium]